MEKLNPYNQVFTIGFVILALSILLTGQAFVVTWEYQNSHSPPYHDYTYLVQAILCGVGLASGILISAYSEEITDWYLKKEKL